MFLFIAHVLKCHCYLVITGLPLMERLETKIHTFHYCCLNFPDVFITCSEDQQKQKVWYLTKNVRVQTYLKDQIKCFYRRPFFKPMCPPQDMQRRIHVSTKNGRLQIKQLVCFQLPRIKLIIMSGFKPCILCDKPSIFRMLKSKTLFKIWQCRPPLSLSSFGWYCQIVKYSLLDPFPNRRW